VMRGKSMREQHSTRLGSSRKAKWGDGIAVAGLIISLSACATGNYTPLAGADKGQVEQLKENVYRVEYRVSSFTSQEQLDAYLRRRCAELTLREGYDFFHLAQRADVLALSRRTSMTVTMYKGQKPAGATELYDAKEVLAAPAP
jgi:hypothetical protein